jgi:hypothetical protein
LPFVVPFSGTPSRQHRLFIFPSQIGAADAGIDLMRARIGFVKQISAAAFTLISMRIARNGETLRE